MALTEIEYGSLASSKILNGNFEYLDNRISNTVEDSAGVIAGINSNIASLNNSIDLVDAKIENSKNEFNTTLSENGVYTEIYQDGTSWYREWFSDKEKNERIWLEQGFRVNGNTTVVFLKAFKDTNYTIALTNENSSSQTLNPTYSSLKTDSMNVYTDNKKCSLYLCGN